ncbi:MAG: tRNA 2-thiouridine(34) synthase MnmA [Oscillospiraceae bacterium]
MNKKVLIGMSGGVDSSVAALLLKENGYDVAGVTFKLSENPTALNAKDADDAKIICDTLGINHYILDYSDLFKREVIDYFVEEYMNGRTPNPCIVCNKQIKFKAFLEKANEMGYDYIATGHYAQTSYCEKTGRFSLIQGESDKKDQSYVLFSLTQKQLAQTLFPIGSLTKDEVRKIATDNNLIVSQKPDSQDICFIPSGNYAQFLQDYTGKISPKGNFIDVDGNILGQHLGLWYYTIGQRKGLGMTFGKPMFVSQINPQNNTVTLADDNQIFADSLNATDINFIEIDELNEPIKILAKIRYSHPKTPATLFPLENGVAKVVFDNPQRAITKGQAVVFYLDNHVFGGGIICD